MDTPNKLTNERSEGSATRTPFGEKAVEELQWKEELLLSATPGLKRKTQVAHMIGRVGSDPDDLKAYLRDLSSVLVSQEKRNLTSYLVEATGSPQDHDLREQTDAHSLSKFVFSQLHNTGFRSKARKVGQISIRDTQLHSPLERNSSLADATDYTVNEIPSPTLEYHEPILSPPTLSTDVAGLQEESGNNHTDTSSHSDSTSDSDSVVLEPLPMGQLKRSLRPFMALNNIILNKNSWRVLQNASDTLLERLGQGLTDENNRMIPDRQNILNVFERYEVIPNHATNDDLFELCGRYLPLEDLNSLEMSLFL